MARGRPSGPGHRGRPAGRGGAGARPACWPSCSRTPVDRIDPICDELVESCRARSAGASMWPASPAGPRIQTHPDLAPYVERFANRGVSSPPVGRGARDAGHRRLQPAGLARARSPPCAGSTSTGWSGCSSTAATSPRSAAPRARASPCSTAPPTLFLERLGLDPLDQLPAGGGPPARARGRRRARGADAPGRRWPEGVEAAVRRRAETLRDGERLQKVLARAGVGSRRVCEELIVAGPGHRRRRGAPSSAAASTRDGRRVELDGVPLPVRARARPLPVEQARRRGHDGRRPPGPADGRVPGAPPSRGCSPSGASTGTPRGC